MTASMQVAATLAIGAAAGLHVASWGMYKDSLYEGFSVAKYVRSVLVGALAALLIQSNFHLPVHTPGGALLLFATAYTLERGLVESWKAFLRREDQAKYFIPMSFAVLGRVVTSQRLRLLAGAGYVAVLAAVVWMLLQVQPAGGARPPLLALLAAGSIGGWISAFGGAWKDAPKEGFQLLKFFRSPGLSLVYAAALSELTGSYVLVAFGALGLTIATIETHKKLDRPHDAPGKFSGKPVSFPHMYRARRRVVPVYALISAAVLSVLAMALVDAASGSDVVARVVARG